MRGRILLACSLAVASLAGCSPQPSLFDGDRLVIGVKYDQPGLGYKDHGKTTGFDVRLARHLANALGHDDPILEGVNSTNRAAGLQSDPGNEPKHDMVVASYSMTPERDDEVNFAGPYAKTHQGFMVRSSDLGRLNTLGSLHGEKVCTVVNTTSKKELEEELPEARLIERNDYSTCVEELRAGGVDAVSTDKMVLHGYAKKYEGLAVVPDVELGSPNYYGVALPEGYLEDCLKIRDEIKKYVGSTEWHEAFDVELGSVPSEEHAPDPALIDLESCKEED